MKLQSEVTSPFWHIHKAITTYMCFQTRQEIEKVDYHLLVSYKKLI